VLPAESSPAPAPPPAGEIAAALASLGDPARLHLARLLLDGRFSVSELTAIFAARQPTVSRNLRILADAGLVDARREGRLAWYGWRGELSAAAAGLRDLLHAHVAAPSGELRRRVESVLGERRARASSFFASVDPSDSSAAWMGSPDCMNELLAAVPPGAEVVDLGTGAGRMLPGLAARAGRVIGVDASPSLLDEARRRARTLGPAPVELRLGDIEHLPLRDHEVDSALAHMVLHHVPEPARALREVARVLRPGGALLIGDFVRHDDESMRQRAGDQWLGFEPDELRRWLLASGFASVTIHALPATQAAALPVFVARAERAGTPPPPNPTPRIGVFSEPT
jgi:ArsR family transcriptional regulator